MHFFTIYCKAKRKLDFSIFGSGLLLYRYANASRISSGIKWCWKGTIWIIKLKPDWAAKKWMFIIFVSKISYGHYPNHSFFLPLEFLFRHSSLSNSHRFKCEKCQLNIVKCLTVYWHTQTSAHWCYTVRYNIVI